LGSSSLSTKPESASQKVKKAKVLLLRRGRMIDRSSQIVKMMGSEVNRTERWECTIATKWVAKGKKKGPAAADWGSLKDS